jgi:hypothetical protein
MAEQPAAPILDGLHLTLDLADGDLVANAVVVAKVVADDGQVGVVISNSEGTSWLDQLALIVAASEIVRSNQFTRDDRDD